MKSGLESSQVSENLSEKIWFCFGDFGGTEPLKKNDGDQSHLYIVNHQYV